MNGYQRGLGRTPPSAAAAPGWKLTTLTPPSALYGANGMQFGPDGRLYVAQAFGSRISALDPDRGILETVSPPDGPIVGPDDVAFDSHRNLYVTEVMSARVSVRAPDGTVRVLAGDLPSANGITVHRDRVFVDEHRRGGRLLELYLDGRPPRLVCADLFGPNALMAGPDGKLYFPLVPLGEVWRADPESGALEKVADGLAAPPAVKFSPRGELVVPQARTGEIVRVDVVSGAKTVIARVRPGIDNLAFAPDGRMFVSHFIDGGVSEVRPGAEDGERVLVPPGFVGPWGLAWDGAAGTLYVGDGLSLGALGPGGEVRRLGGVLDEGFPGFVRGLAAGVPGELLVTTARGDVVRYRTAPRAGEARFTTLAKRLEPLAGVAPQGEAVIAVASASGRVVAVDAGGALTPVAEGLAAPKGLALHGTSLWILDVEARSLIVVDLSSGERRVAASALPVGAVGPMDFPGGIAVDGNGTVYVAGSADGSLLALSSN